MNQGDRPAFSNGTLILSAFASVLPAAFRGDTHSLIPLYMIGVFVSFTLSLSAVKYNASATASQASTFHSGGIPSSV
jgi:hypothetical protein